MILQVAWARASACLEVEILLHAVAVGPHLAHGLGAEDVLEDGGVEGAVAGMEKGPFRNMGTSVLASGHGRGHPPPPVEGV